MSWSKVKKQLESFLCPALVGRVQYIQASYRYLPGTSGQCYIVVDQKKVFHMSDPETSIKWYETEMEIKNDPSIELPISEADLKAVEQETKGAIPADRLRVIVRNRKITTYAKQLLAAQASLSKADFIAVAQQFLAAPLEESIASDDILRNVFALMDRRLGKKRLATMSEAIKLKHPIVQYFYHFRLASRQ